METQLERRIGNTRDMRILEDPPIGAYGAQLGIAYLQAAHNRIHRVIPFHVDAEMPNLDAPAEAVNSIMNHLPTDVDRRLVLGGAVVAPSILDRESDLRPNETGSRFKLLASFLIRANGAEPVPILPLTKSELNRHGIGNLYLHSSGARQLAHGIVLPNPHPTDVSAAIRLTDTKVNGIYAALHSRVPEIVVSREELDAKGTTINHRKGWLRSLYTGKSWKFSLLKESI